MPEMLCVYFTIPFIVAMHPMMDGYGDRMGYGPPGMPPGGPAGGIPNPAMQQRMRYAAMMGQERWPPPHQYMQPSQRPQGMSGPVNRFQVYLCALLLGRLCNIYCMATCNIFSDIGNSMYMP